MPMARPRCCQASARVRRITVFTEASPRVSRPMRCRSRFFGQWVSAWRRATRRSESESPRILRFNPGSMTDPDLSFRIRDRPTSRSRTSASVRMAIRRERRVRSTSGASELRVSVRRAARSDLAATRKS